MTVLTILATGMLCIACLYMGAKLGQTTYKGEKVEMPTLNPVTIVREQKEKKAAEKEAAEEKTRMDILLHNIDTYDGTDIGQQDIPL